METIFYEINFTRIGLEMWYRAEDESRQIATIELRTEELEGEKWETIRDIIYQGSDFQYAGEDVKIQKQKFVFNMLNKENTIHSMFNLTLIYDGLNSTRSNKSYI